MGARGLTPLRAVGGGELAGPAIEAARLPGPYCFLLFYYSECTLNFKLLLIWLPRRARPGKLRPYSNTAFPFHLNTCSGQPPAQGVAGRMRSLLHAAMTSRDAPTVMFVKPRDVGSVNGRVHDAVMPPLAVAAAVTCDNCSTHWGAEWPAALKRSCIGEGVTCEWLGKRDGSCVAAAQPP